MTLDEARMVLCANVMVACDKANLDDSTKKMVEDALDMAVEALSNVQRKEEINQSLLYENERLLKSVQEIKAEIREEKEFAYADFERYKVECLGQDWEDAYDSLPQDDFRYGMERCLEIINRHMSWEGEK